MNNEQLLNKAGEILDEHYSSILNGRKITTSEIIAEAKNLIRKWDDACFLVNFNFMHKLEKEEWIQIAQMLY